nr:unnamed protein product [Callosobruchus analis]
MHTVCNSIHLWKTVYINTNYIPNVILFEKNQHFKSIDLHCTSSPLFVTRILLVRGVFFK